MFGLIQTALENGLEPFRYLTLLLRTANTADLIRPEVVRQLLPLGRPAGMQNEITHIRHRWIPTSSVFIRR